MSELLTKVCGLTRAEDVQLCLELEVDFMGFIFVPASPRHISREAVAGFSRGAQKKIGVFAGNDLDYIVETLDHADLDYAQLHGGESPDFCRAVGPERVIKTFWPQNMSLDELETEMERFAPVAAYYLLDAGSRGGGSGASLQWSDLSQLRSPRPWLLAGGLGCATLPEALAVCSPDGVDMNSALEIAPGIKDHTHLRSALNILRDLKQQRIRS